MSQADLNGNAASAVTSLPMPATVPATGSASVRGAIARAAQATGVDFSYLLAQARLESSLDPQAHSPSSSAAGLYQFTKGTWGTMLARHGDALGAAVGSIGAGAGGSVSRSRLMALRYDPNAAAMMAAQLAGDNGAALTGVLGRAPTSSELYLAHFLGAAGATRFLGALSADPGQSAAALLPRAAAANTGVFYDAGGTPRSLGAVMALIQTRMDGALQGGGLEGGALQAGTAGGSPDVGGFAATNDPGGLGAPAVTPFGSGPIARQFGDAQAAGGMDPGAESGAETGPAAQIDGASSSMSDTLRHTFGVTAEGAGAAPAFVRSIYGQMQAFGL